MIPIKGYSTFDPLKHCIVGRGQDPKNATGSLQDIMYSTEEDLQSLIKVLESLGVVCYRPNNNANSERPPISPRDYFVVLGEELLVGKMIAGYDDILKSIDRKGIKWYLSSDISSANMIRCGKHIHWDISKLLPKELETEITAYLRFNKKYNLSVTRYGWHMDGLYSIVTVSYTHLTLPTKRIV